MRRVGQPELVAFHVSPGRVPLNSATFGSHPAGPLKAPFLQRATGPTPGDLKRLLVVAALKEGVRS